MKEWPTFLRDPELKLHYLLYRGKEKIHSENKVNCLSIQVLQSD